MLMLVLILKPRESPSNTNGWCPSFIYSLWKVLASVLKALQSSQCMNCTEKQLIETWDQQIKLYFHNVLTVACT